MAAFNLDYFTIPLKLKHDFTIARGTKTVVNNVLIKLEKDGFVGFGEAAPNKRYNENDAIVKRFLDQLDDDFWAKIDAPESLPKALDELIPQVYSAKTAVEMAYLDWWGKKMAQPLYRLWKAPGNVGPVSSFTIGIDEPDSIVRKIEEAEEYPLLKIKLSGDSRKDRAIIETIRKTTDKPVRVDVNEGWTDLEQAKTGIRYLADKNINLVEQPMPADNWQDLCDLKDFSPLPLCADEGFTGRESIPMIANAYPAINIKLMKTGSLLLSRNLIREAQENDLEIMIGCMIESSLADSASALLSLWADYADLDGHLLIENDDFDGLKLDHESRITLPEDRSGLGVEPTEKWGDLKEKYAAKVAH